MRRLIWLLLIVVLGAIAVAPGPAFAQNQAPPHRRTLLEMLFGPRTAPPPPPVQQTAPPPPRRRAPPARLPPAKPTIAKAPGATRIAVFGDSLAIDLGKGLVRAYADDPDIAILQQGVGSSGLVRQDYFDWSKAIGKEIAANSFDLAVVLIGINDRQNIRTNGQSLKPLTDPWKAVYTDRLGAMLGELRVAGKPVVWVGLPPFRATAYNAAMTQITTLQKLASYGNGADFVDIYNRFLDDNGNYSSYGPDINGQQVLLRRSDGIHFTNAGADKLAFYVTQAITLFYHGGHMSIEVTDPLAGTDADKMLRPPLQGVGQTALLQVAGAVTSLTGIQPRADALVDAALSKPAAGFDAQQMVDAPEGRADAFGAGVVPTAARPKPR